MTATGTAVSSVVLVGGGTASAAAAATLRSLGYDGRVVLVAEEDTLPYERPPLSKEVLAGAFPPERTEIRDAAWWDAAEIELRLGTRAVAVEAGTVELVDGHRVAYDRLLLATGGHARRLAWLDGDRVCYLRTLPDAMDLGGQLDDLAQRGGRLAILGGGFIGCEVAATACGRGIDVTVIEQTEVCLQQPLGTRYGRVLTAVHRDAGVTLHLAERVDAVAHNPDGLTVRTPQRTIGCDALLVAAGMVPNDDLAAGTPIMADDGILVDERCRTTVPGVFAAGDVARQRLPGAPAVRVEHHDTATRHGQAAARAMLGAPSEEPSPHWFWSDQYDLSIQSLGPFDPDAAHVLRGTLEERCFTAFQLRGAHVEAALTVGRPHDILACRRLIRTGTPVTAEQLSDPDVDLRRLALARSTR